MSEPNVGQTQSIQLTRDLLADYHSGSACEALASKYGLSFSTIEDILLRHPDTSYDQKC